MGRRFPSSGPGASGGGGSIGEFNQVEVFGIDGAFTWTTPTNISGDRILVHVWGAGGCGGSDSATSAGGSGGGGGGLAVKYIDVSALGATETITVGTGSELISGKGGTSSFGSHCSATGGNSGSNAIDNLGTAVTRPDQGVANNYQAQGGTGVGGDRNTIGGWGGWGYFSSSNNAGGGGGGSAPAPYAYIDGFMGGGGYTYAGGGGAGIGGQGGAGDYPGGGGGGSAGPGHNSNSTTYYSPPPGGPGINGPAGTPGGANYSYVSYGGTTGNQGKPPGGYAVIEPNQILFGGGGGSGGMGYTVSSGYSCGAPGPGAPGGGGGGIGTNTTTAFYEYAAPGGVLGGGGGANQVNYGGAGGNGGGGGGCGYGGVGYCGYGGDGLIIIQYKVT